MQITQDSLSPFLSSHLQVAITDIAPTGFGEWSQTFIFSAHEQRKVIRFSAFDEDFKKDRFAARYASPNLPVPPVEEIGQAFGLFFAITPFVEGQMIDHFSAAEMQSSIPALMSLLNALREVDGSQTRGYGGFGADGNGTILSWHDYLLNMTADTPESRLQGWKEHLAKNQEAEQLYWQGRQRLVELVPLCPEDRHLIHNDLLHFNLIMRDNHVAAVIDWGCALWGDFLYDLAMFTTWQFYYPAMAEIHFAEEARRSFTAKNVPLPHFYERLQCYQIHLLLDSLAYNAWKVDPVNLKIAAGRLKEILAGPGSDSTIGTRI